MNWSPSSRRRAWERLVAAAPPAWVLEHARAVEGLAAAMAARAADRGHAPDVDAVLVGALLHDVGRSVTQDVRHAGVGADLLREDRPPWPAPIVRIVETHTGAGIPPDEARAAGLPDRNYMPTTVEERIVAHADNLHAGPRRLRLAAVLAKYEAKGLHAAGQRIAALHTAMAEVCGVDVDALEPMELPAP